MQNWQIITTHTHTHLTALCPGLPGWAGTRKVKPIWILLKQETVSGSGIRWAICKSAPRSSQITTPVPHRSSFYRPDALPAAQPTASEHWWHIITIAVIFIFLVCFCADPMCGCMVMSMAMLSTEAAWTNLKLFCSSFYILKPWIVFLEAWCILHCTLSFLSFDCDVIVTSRVVCYLSSDTSWCRCSVQTRHLQPKTAPVLLTPFSVSTRSGNWWS